MKQGEGRGGGVAEGRRALIKNEEKRAEKVE